MHKRLSLLLGHFERNAIQREVEEEFQFHLEMQARDYERQGLTPEEARAKAKLRFGDFDLVKTQCVQLGSKTNTGTRILKVLFTIAFLLGVLIRSLYPELHLTRVGDVLIMIAAFGGLLVLGKRIRLGDFKREPEPIRLGLDSPSYSMPLAFDELGRTPFERVKTDQ